MIYGSVCSGIEAASVAWEPIGWKPAWFAEIEPFPSAVLAHHWPHVTNLGDMTRIAEQVANDNVPAPDVLVGGTPCQAFSVAGARRGLEDDRGFLTIKFVELANAIDQRRSENDNDPAIIVWENVPGVLSSKDNAFGAFLGLLSGEDCELVPPGRKWSNAGYVHGPQRTIAWRVLDAQYFGVAKRRRRVFVVASARTDFDPSKVLFEREGVRRDTPPGREAGSVVAALTANGVGTCGADDNQGQAGHLIAMAHGQGGAEIRDDGLCPTLTCNHEAPIGVYSVHGTQDPDTNTELAHTLGRNQGQENAVCVTGAITHTLKAEGFDASEDDTGREQPIVPVAVAMRESGHGYWMQDDIAGTLRAEGENRPSRPSHVIKHPDMSVRRLTPVECERLQGFPDGHTDVPYRGKSAADGPRYKAIGNSMAVPVMRWIGKRIKLHLEAL